MWFAVPRCAVLSLNHTNTCTYTYTYTHIHTYTHTHIHTYTHTHIHVHSGTHVYVLCTRAHTCTHAHMHICTHRTSTNSQSCYARAMRPPCVACTSTFRCWRPLQASANSRLAWTSVTRSVLHYSAQSTEIPACCIELWAHMWTWAAAPGLARGGQVPLTRRVRMPCACRACSYQHSAFHVLPCTIRPKPRLTAQLSRFAFALLCWLAQDADSDADADSDGKGKGKEPEVNGMRLWRPYLPPVGASTEN